jgi:hypothetical protein
MRSMESRDLSSYASIRRSVSRVRGLVLDQDVGRQPPLLTLRLMAPRLAWKRMPISTAASISSSITSSAAAGRVSLGPTAAMRFALGVATSFVGRYPSSIDFQPDNLDLL